MFDLMIIGPLFDDSKGLRESNDELQAQLFSRGLEEGRTLLNEHNDNSLAAEFEVMSQEDVSHFTYSFTLHVFFLTYRSR